MRKAVKRSYLTKRATAIAARRGFIEAAKETMAIMGFNVIARDGYVVKINRDGQVIERISRIPNYNTQGKLHLD